MSKNFVIIEPDAIVAMDVEGLLISQFPRARISTGVSLADIGPAIHNCGPDCTVVVKGTLLAEDGDLWRVARRAAVRNARIVVIGEPFECDFPATFVRLPFTSDMVLAAMAQGTPEPDRDPAPLA